MKTVYAFVCLMIMCSAHMLISCPTGIDELDDDAIITIIDEDDDVFIGTDLILTP